MVKVQKPVEMDLNLMRSGAEQRTAEKPPEVHEPVASIEERRAHFGSQVLGFVGGAAHVLDRMGRR